MVAVLNAGVAFDECVLGRMALMERHYSDTIRPSSVGEPHRHNRFVSHGRSFTALFLRLPRGCGISF